MLSRYVYEQNAYNQTLNLPPIVYDDANQHGVLTRRLLILMKRELRLLGDVPRALAMDGAQYFDTDYHEDYPIEAIREEFGFEVTLLPRESHTTEFQERRNRFCVLSGVNGKVVIGAY